MAEAADRLGKHEGWCLPLIERILVQLLVALAAGLSVQLTWAQGSAGPYVPTPTRIVERLLEFAEVKRDDYLIDLGSGDGRIVITAAKKYGARGHGIDIQDKLVELATRNALIEHVEDRVRFVRGDLFDADLSRASLVTLYLLPNTITKLVSKILKELGPGARVVSHDYPLAPWKPERYATFDFEEKRTISGTTLTVFFLYIVPARLQGVWELNLPELHASSGKVRMEVTQRPDQLAGNVDIGGENVMLRDFTVKGEDVQFTLALRGMRTLELRGKAKEGEIEGVVETTSGVKRWSARRISAAH